VWLGGVKKKSPGFYSETLQKRLYETLTTRTVNHRNILRSLGNWINGNWIFMSLVDLFDTEPWIFWIMVLRFFWILFPLSAGWFF